MCRLRQKPAVASTINSQSSNLDVKQKLVQCRPSIRYDTVVSSADVAELLLAEGSQ